MRETPEIPQHGDKASFLEGAEGFSLDREFGEGADARLRKALEESIARKLDEDDYLNAASDAARYMILAGERCWDDASHERIVKKISDEITDLGLLSQEGLPSSLMYYRVLTGKRQWEPSLQKSRAEAVGRDIRAGIARRKYERVAPAVADLRALVGSDEFAGRSEIFGDLYARNEMSETLKCAVESHLKEGEDLAASWAASRRRILNAHRVVFEDGSGIRLEDKPPPKTP